MAKEYFKATHNETGEEQLAFITQATAIRVKRQIGRALGYDSFDRLAANIYYALHRDTACGLDAKAFDAAMVEWLDEWTVDVSEMYDADGKKIKEGADGAETEDEPDPLP